MAKAATRGPVPKRSTERRRRNADSKPDMVKALVDQVAIPQADAKWHPIAKDWYASLQTSGQSQYFEPSDWQYARYLAEACSRNLRQGQRFSSVLFAAVMSGMNDLLTTESARRRVRMEIERGGQPEGASAGVTAIADYRKRIKAKTA